MGFILGVGHRCLLRWMLTRAVYLSMPWRMAVPLKTSVSDDSLPAYVICLQCPSCLTYACPHGMNVSEGLMYNLKAGHLPWHTPLWVDTLQTEG